MSTSAIVFGLLAILLLAYVIWSRFVNVSPKPDRDTTRPSPVYLPKHEIQNDKIVVVNDASNAEIERILIEFCNRYNKESYRAVPRLYRVDADRCAITFPYDIRFVTFCFFVNYARYPIGFDRSFEVVGWTTATSMEKWVPDKAADKKVMVFVPEDDDEYDNVYLTTSDNIGYKIGFAMGEDIQPLDFPKQGYLRPNIDAEDLKDNEYRDFT